MSDESDEVEEILKRQDEAFALLERLRGDEPHMQSAAENDLKNPPDARRWPIPAGVTIEMHDGHRWHLAECIDLGVGGARLRTLPFPLLGPSPTRLSTHDTKSVLVLSDMMWREAEGGVTGIRFEFFDNEERERWAGGLINALLARYSLR